ncbi:MAG TPA: BlaI/MecI/CopY family transcriptional regulator [Gemmatimonadaceae bacterium]|nr:BlaI/MecI/CopY family transcriptional regulator [Gemmatimonadaceae bacterium]
MTRTDDLSRREREILDTLYALGPGAAKDVAAFMREPDALDTIRVTLGVLERKGYVRHRVEGRRNVYSPVQPADEARRGAFRKITRTFFGGSPSRALMTLLDISGDRLEDDDLDKLSEWVKSQSRRRKKAK